MSSSRAAWILPEAEDENPKQEGSANHSADVKNKERSCKTRERTEEVPREGIGLDQSLRKRLIADGQPLQGADQSPVVPTFDNGHGEGRNVGFRLVRSRKGLSKAGHPKSISTWGKKKTGVVGNEPGKWPSSGVGR